MVVIQETSEEIENIIHKVGTNLNININIIFNESQDECQKLLLESACDVTIINDNNLSWWAGYFNTNGKIIYPYLWKGEVIDENLSPDTWVKIEF